MSISDAIALATKVHVGQKDKAGAPYILHPLRVMFKVPDIYKAVAVLHDAIEDCPNEGYSLLNIIDDETRTALIPLIRLSSVDYDVYIKEIGKDPRATCIKIADLEDNMDLRRNCSLGYVSSISFVDRDFIRIRKYMAAYRYLLSIRRDYCLSGKWLTCD